MNNPGTFRTSALKSPLFKTNVTCHLNSRALKLKLISSPTSSVKKTPLSIIPMAHSHTRLTKRPCNYTRI